MTRLLSDKKQQYVSIGFGLGGFAHKVCVWGSPTCTNGPFLPGPHLPAPASKVCIWCYQVSGGTGS